MAENMPHAVEAQIQKDLRWNCVATVLDGTFYWFGANFVAASTILPLYARHLTDSRVLIGLIATIAGSGWYLPQLLTARYVEALPRKKPIVVNYGFFLERLPSLFMALSAFLFAERAPSLALTLLLITYGWQMTGAGAVAVAWQEMLAKVIPIHYRGRLLGTANFFGTATGTLGAMAAAVILARYPFPRNYALCFAVAFVAYLISWCAVALTREPALESRKTIVPFQTYLRQLPAIVRGDRNFALYLLTRSITAFARMGVGFLTVYAAERWGMSDSQAGVFTTVLLIGQASANLLFGAFGDRHGHKMVLEISLAMCTLSMAIALLSPSLLWLYAAFVAIGAFFAMDILPGIAIAMEFAGPELRPTYMGLANTLPGFAAAVAPLLGGWIASVAGYRTTFGLAALLGLVALIVLHWAVREPRHR